MLRGGVLFLVLSASIAVLTAPLSCSSDPDRPPASPGTGTAQPGGPIGAGGTEAGANEDAALPQGDAGACNAFDNVGQLVDQLGQNGDPPVETGGAIVDGTYELTSDTIFVGAGGVGGPTGVQVQATIEVTAGVLERAISLKDTNNGQTSDRRETFHFATSNADFALAETCPLNTAAVTDTYSATATTLTISDPQAREVFVYTLR
jgi:hypothetical protein